MDLANLQLQIIQHSTSILIGVLVGLFAYFIFVHDRLREYFRKRKEKKQQKNEPEKQQSIIDSPFLDSDIEQEFDMLVVPKSKDEKIKELIAKLEQIKNNSYYEMIRLRKENDSLKSSFIEHSARHKEATEKIEIATKELAKSKTEKFI